MEVMITNGSCHVHASGSDAAFIREVYAQAAFGATLECQL
jgi:hypothetical protein